MSFKIRDNNNREYVSYYVRSTEDQIFDVLPGHMLDSKYMEYIKQHRKNSMFPLTFLIGWIMFPMGIAVVLYTFNLLTGNFEAMGYDSDANTMTIVTSIIAYVILLGLFLLLLKAFRLTLKYNTAPDASHILWRKGLLTDKHTSYRDHHTKHTLKINNEPMYGATINDYNAGRKDDEYIVIYRLNDSGKLVETFAIYADIEQINLQNNKGDYE